ncbi:MAG: hypothetical protein ACYC3I_22075 [Gemmataceae bacterium]
MRTWMSLIPAILLILISPATLLQAADPELTIKKEDFQKLLDKVDKLQSDMTSNSLRGNHSVEELRAIREELQKIRELLEIMARQQGAIQRQAGFGPPSVPAAVPSTGTVTVQNVYTAPATVRLNGQTHRVDPGQTLPIFGVPLGTIQYSVEVDGFGLVEPLRTDVIRTGAYRIKIFPKMPN